MDPWYVLMIQWITAAGGKKMYHNKKVEHWFNRKTTKINILVLIGVIDTGAAYSLLRQIYSIGLSIYGLSESKI